YGLYSSQIHKILEEFTPVVEMVSIDEAYLDLTGSERLLGPTFAAADRLVRSVKARTGLNCSVGASTSHLVSKIASDQAKPHGLLFVFPGCEAKFLAPLPIRRMPGIGKVTEPELLALGIHTIGDLQHWSPEGLEQRFGKYGGWLYRKARGQEIDAYGYEEQPKSISHETTFDTDTGDGGEVERTLSYLAQLVGRRLRDHGLHARTVGLKLRFAPFKTLTRDATLDEPTNLDSVIFSNVLRLLANAWNGKQKIRLVGVRTSNLERAVFQRSLIDAAQHEKLDKVLKAADKLRQKFGFDAVQLARSVETGKQPKPRKGREFLGREN